MSGIETKNIESYLDDEYEEVVLEESDEGKKKRSVWRVLRLVFLILCGLAVIAALVVFFVAKNAIRDGGYAETWVVEAHGEILEDRSYGENPQQVMDVYVPRTLDPAKANGAILFIHGGAWIGGGRWEQEAFAKMMAKEGYLTGNMEYTLYNNDLKERNDEYSIELVLEDVRLALAKLVEIGEEYGYHIDRVALSGHSAGGHISMLYGFRSGTREDFATPVKIAFVAPRVGPFDFHAKTWDIPHRVDPTTNNDPSEDSQSKTWTEEKRIATMAKIASFLSGVEISERQYLNPDEKTEAAIESISPLYDVKPGVPPIFAAYGAKDIIVPSQNYKLLKHAFSGLKAKSVADVEPDDTETQVFDLLVFPNSNHMLARDPDYTLKWRGLFLSYASRYLTTPVEPSDSVGVEEIGDDVKTSSRAEDSGAEAETKKSPSTRRGSK